MLAVAPGMLQALGVKTPRLVIALALACVLVCAGCDWAQWAANAARSGTNLEPDVTAAKVPQFVASTVSTNPLTGQATAVAGGLVFGQRDGLLTAYDAKTYGVVWTAALPAGSTAGSVPAVDAGTKTVFVVVSTASSPVLLGFDIEGFRNCNTIDNTCRALFAAQLGTGAAPAAPPLVDGGRVFANGASNLDAFDAAGKTNCGTFLGTHLCNSVWSAPTGLARQGVGPSTAGGTVFVGIQTGPNFGLRALNASNGSILWTAGLPGAPNATPATGDGRVFVPATSRIDVFAQAGCGVPLCTSLFGLVVRSGDPVRSFLGTPAIDGTNVFATNGNGALYKYATTCGSPTCQPTATVFANAPSGGSTTYSQSPAVASGMASVLARRVIAAANHDVLLVYAASNLSGVKSFDLGVGDFGAGLSSVSVAWGVIYAPISTGLVAIHPPPVEPLASLTVSPLTLSPAFSRSTFDYTVLCASGTNNLTFTMTAVAGGSVRMVAPISTSPSASQSTPVALVENQAAVIEAKDAQGNGQQYWIRCLPHDFPTVVATRHPENGAPTPGWYLTGNFGTDTTGAFAMILNANGTPVWYQRSIPQPQNVSSTGKNSITYMKSPPFAFQSDDSIVWDVHDLASGSVTHTRFVGAPTDFHELQRLDNGNFLLLAYPLKSGVDLTGLPTDPPAGANSTIVDCRVQEVTPQGQVVFSWTATDHLNLKTESLNVGTATLNGQTVYDPIHCNSIDPNPNGNLLISARHLHAVFEIRRSDGKVLWKLGGTNVNKDGAQIIAIQNYLAGGISRQHDARYRPTPDHISMWDNESLTPNAGRAVEFAINHANGTAQPVFTFIPPNNRTSLATGTFRRYSDGDSVVGQGATQTPDVFILNEVNANGQDVLDLAFASPQSVYRAPKAPPNRYDINILRATAGQ